MAQGGQCYPSQGSGSVSRAQSLEPDGWAFQPLPGYFPNTTWPVLLRHTWEAECLGIMTLPSRYNGSNISLVYGMIQYNFSGRKCGSSKWTQHKITACPTKYFWKWAQFCYWQKEGNGPPSHREISDPSAGIRRAEGLCFGAYVVITTRCTAWQPWLHHYRPPFT